MKKVINKIRMKYPKPFEVWWTENQPKPMYHVPYTGMLIDMEPFKEIAFKAWVGGQKHVNDVLRAK